jgi:hypothetical protein
MKRAAARRAKEQEAAVASERQPSSQALGRAAKPNAVLLSELRHSHPWTFQMRRLAYHLEMKLEKVTPIEIPNTT